MEYDFSHLSKAEKLRDSILWQLQSHTSREVGAIVEKALSTWNSGTDQAKSETIWNLIVISIEISKNTEPWRQWIQWFKLEPSLRPPRTVFCQDKYWQLLCDGLQESSNEKQKICLFLLRKSVLSIDYDVNTQLMSFNKAEKETVQNVVERFCRSYETIIVGRYLHQVRECLKGIPKDFLKARKDSSTKSQFELSSAWWIALLYASTANSISHRLATVVGTWTMEQYFTTVTFKEQFASFLSNRLIPWAAQGHLFRDGLVRDEELVICPHGNLVSSFFSRLFRASVDRGVVKRYLLAIFKALSRKAYDPRAFGFIIQGLDTLTFKEWTSLPSGDDVELLMDSQFIQDLYGKSGLKKDIKRICDYHLDSLSNLLNLKNYPPELEPEEPDISKSSVLQGCVSIEQICQSIRNFPDAKLPYLDLLNSISRLTAELDNQDLAFESIPCELVLEAFQKIWIHAERTKFGKICIRRLPDLFFGRSAILLRKNNQSFQAFLSSRLMDLLNLSESKIYIWNPLTKSIWRAYLQIPGFARVLKLDKFLVGFANKPPVPNQEQLLEFALGQNFSKLTGKSAFAELADEGRGHAFLFDLLNRLRAEDYDMGCSMIKVLMKPFLGVQNRRDTGGHLPRQLCVVQSLFILSERCHMSDDDAQQYRNDLRSALKLGVGPRMRFFLEYLLVAAYWNRLNQPDWVPDDLLDEISCMSHDEDSVTKQMVSLIKVGLHLSRHETVSESYIQRFMNLLPALSSFDKIVIKREALWTFPQMMDIARERHIDSISRHPAFVQLDDYVRSLRNFKNPPESRKLEKYNPITDRTLSVIFEGTYQFLENLSPSVVKAKYFNNIDNIYHDLKPVDFQERSVPIGNLISRAPEQPLLNQIVEHSASTTTPFQSKAFTFTDEAEDSTEKPKKSNLILVASFIDSPYNLGGLTRVAEIFGCAELHLANINLTKENAFTSVAVSSQDHVKILETPIAELTDLCEIKRQEGWTIVGVEQTDSSLILGNTKTILPKKAVIIMGAESTGIPPELLVECDICVEIKQWGVTRSLNVQTAAATVLYEWRRQWSDCE